MRHLPIRHRAGEERVEAGNKIEHLPRRHFHKLFRLEEFKVVRAVVPAHDPAVARMLTAHVAGLLPAQVGEIFGGEIIARREGGQQSGVADEGLPAVAVEGLELVEVLQDRPELDAEPARDARRVLDRRQIAELGEFVEDE